MKTIHVLRHAKSSWSNPDLVDVERSLNSRGRNACRLMAQPIYKSGCHFINMHVSAAKRALETIEGIADELKPLEINWQTTEQLYRFSEFDLAEFLRTQDERWQEVMMIGHNPAITEIANSLGDQELVNVPTCGYVQLISEAESWLQVSEAKATTQVFLYPKLYDGRD